MKAKYPPDNALCNFEVNCCIFLLALFLFSRHSVYLCTRIDNNKY